MFTQGAEIDNCSIRHINVSFLGRPPDSRLQLGLFVQYLACIMFDSCVIVRLHPGRRIHHLLLSLN